MRIGIDLGTTRSAAAVMEAGDPTLLMNDRGDRLTLSLVHYDDDGVHIGKQARANSDAGTLIKGIKRHMGEDYTVTANGVDHTPPEVSSEIVEEIVSYSESYLDEEIDELVITVPAYFTADQKQATLEAAEHAGFDQEDVELLYEPTAAAIAYGYDAEKDETVLIYDFGGGTLDISVMDIDGNHFSTLATSGDTELGGTNFTEAIVDLVADEYEEEHGTDIRSDPEAREKLRQAAEERKKDLSASEQTTINEPLLGTIDGEVVGIQKRAISRDEFEDAADDLLQRSIEPVKEALDKAGLDKTEIDSVLLVGGSSKIPAVQDRLENFFGFEPDTSTDLDRIVARGAAIVADDDGETPVSDYRCPQCGEDFEKITPYFTHIVEEHGTDKCPFHGCEYTPDDESDLEAHLAEEHSTDIATEGGSGGGGNGITKEEVVNRPLGTDVKGGRMNIILEDGMTLPAKNTKTYTTSRKNQTEVPVHVYQGENTENREENEQLRSWRLEGIPEMDAQEPIIDVTFELEEDGTLDVTAEERKSGTVDAEQVNIHGDDDGGDGSGEKVTGDD